MNDIPNVKKNLRPTGAVIGYKQELLNKKRVKRAKYEV